MTLLFWMNVLVPSGASTVTNDAIGTPSSGGFEKSATKLDNWTFFSFSWASCKNHFVEAGNAPYSWSIQVTPCTSNLSVPI